MSDDAPSMDARSEARVATPQARRYLVQLCKHFAHKRPVTYDERSGHVGLSAGDCRLKAEDGALLVSLQATDAAQLDQLKDVVVRHLVRFAFREDLAFAWHDAPREDA